MSNCIDIRSLQIETVKYPIVHNQSVCINVLKINDIQQINNKTYMKCSFQSTIVCNILSQCLFPFYLDIEQLQLIMNDTITQNTVTYKLYKQEQFSSA